MNNGTHKIPRIGLVGVSGYARIHLDLIRKTRKELPLILASVVIINYEEEAELVEELRLESVVVYQSFEDFISNEKDKLDLCCIPTGIASHMPMTLSALKAGMNVLVEKPLAGSLREVDEIIAAEKQSGKFVAVGFQDIYTDLIMRLKRCILSGGIGTLEEIRFMGLWPRPRGYYSRNKWAGKLTVDGVLINDSPLNNAFAHFPHLALFLAGSTLRGVASARLIDGELFRTHCIESFDTAVIRAQSDEGVRFWFGVTHACQHERNPEIHIKGTEGDILWKYEENCYLFKTNQKVVEFPVYDGFGARESMFRAVLQRTIDPNVFISKPEYARSHTALIESIHQKLNISNVPENLIQSFPSGVKDHNKKIPVYQGIEEALLHAFREGSCLCDVDNA